MKSLVNYLKGIVVGVGGIAPGLSGSVMLIILGLYERTIAAIGTMFKNFKANVAFLIPLLLGFGTGVLLFSKAVDFLLAEYEFTTRYLFLGLVVGTVPLFYKEVKKNGFGKRYVATIIAAAGLGLFLFSFNSSLFPAITNPNLLQSVLLGVAVAGSAIVPGVDSAVILSALGLYELYVSSLANLNMPILLPAAAGLVIGAITVSIFMNMLIKRFYTGTFSVIFGLFLSIIPSVVNESCVIASAGDGAFAALCIVVGFAVSFYLGDIQGNNERLKKLFGKK
ncbi:MAG: DUF368 domain-containing protein [Clostridia bacterium]|nr:DUF368 domain-containing protein [Clostridia bacterium]